MWLPFELDLMSGQISFLNITAPVGNYDELEFDPFADEEDFITGGTADVSNYKNSLLSGWGNPVHPIE